MSKKVQDAITALANLYICGPVMADTQPSEFLEMVTEDVIALRAECGKYRKALQLISETESAELAQCDAKTALGGGEDE